MTLIKISVRHKRRLACGLLFLLMVVLAACEDSAPTPIKVYVTATFPPVATVGGDIPTITSTATQEILSPTDSPTQQVIPTDLPTIQSPPTTDSGQQGVAVVPTSTAT